MMEFSKDGEDGFRLIVHKDGRVESSLASYGSLWQHGNVSECREFHHAMKPRKAAAIVIYGICRQLEALETQNV